MTLSFKKATLGTTEYLNNGTKLSVLKPIQTRILTLESPQRLSTTTHVFEIGCEDSFVKVGQRINVVWELSANKYDTQLVFTTTFPGFPYEDEAIQSDPIEIGGYEATCLLATARAANTFFGEVLNPPVTHPVLALLFSNPSHFPTYLPYVNTISVSGRTGVEITADDIKKDGVSIIGGSSVEPASVTTAGIVKLTEATGAEIFNDPEAYDSDGDTPIVLTASQIKAMILEAMGQAPIIPPELNLVTEYKLSMDNPDALNLSHPDGANEE